MAITVVLASGGINSTVAACRARQNADVYLVHVDYGQPQAAPQRVAVRKLAEHLRATFTSLDLPHVAQVANLGKPAVEGSPAESAAAGLDIMSRVPGLVTVLLGASVQVAHRIGASLIHVGTSEAADEAEVGAVPGAGTPAHRRDVFYLYNVLLERLQRSKSPIRLEAPLWDLTRPEIIKLGMRYNTPFDYIYACLTGRGACGNCADCVARNNAFSASEIADPRAKFQTAAT
jgi:7-cyano-7-deazaguanine synthase